MANDEYQTL